MVRNNINRIKAAVISAAMVATTFASPLMTSLSSVNAAAKEITSLPYTFVADGVDDGQRQGNVALPKGTKAGDTITLSFTTSSTVNATIAVYGFGTDSAADEYWVNYEKEFSTGGKSTLECQVTIPTAMKGNPTKVGVGIWYPEDNSEYTLTSLKNGSSTNPDNPDKPNIPTSSNNKSGTCKLVDNHDGTATISATLAAQFSDGVDADGNKKTEFDYPLTLGHDEEDYAPYKDADGNTLPVFNPKTDTINSHKFSFSGFGIDDINKTNTTFESVEYVITCDDYSMSEIQYGGGINVLQGSDADTEIVKGKDGYWYNDQGTEDMEQFGSEFKIEDVHGAYIAENCGKYAKIVWDVPKGVQPCVDFSGTGNVGLQYWWGRDNSVPSEINGEAQNYTEIPEIHVKSATIVYTRTMTVPYNETINGPTNIKLASGGNEKISLADLELGERDKLSAVEFTFKSAEALQKFVGGCGISVDSTKGNNITGVSDGWYQSNDIAVINCENNTFKLMWIIPDSIRNVIYAGTADDAGDVLIGYWYGDVEGGTTVDDITVSDVKFHIYRSQEEDVVIKGEDGLEIEKTLTLKVGDTYTINSNVDGVTFESSNPLVATVDENGEIEALKKGLTNIKVVTPEGQEATIEVTVIDADVTTTTTVVTTTPQTSTTVATTTTVDPNSVVDVNRVLYGDVTVNGKVQVDDLVTLSKHLLNAELFKLKNATAKENADCVYDHSLDTSDSGILAEYLAGLVDLMDLGPADKSGYPMYVNLT